MARARDIPRVIAAAIILPASAAAQTPRPDLTLPTMTVQAKPTHIGGKAGNACVAVDIAGRRAGDADCAAQKLQDAARAAQDKAADRPVTDAPSAASPDTRIGIANETATRQRLGNAFGKSVLPQRPMPPPATPSPFARR